LILVTRFMSKAPPFLQRRTGHPEIQNQRTERVNDFETHDGGI
jgi:hypothetical protein